MHLRFKFLIYSLLSAVLVSSIPVYAGPISSSLSGTEMATKGSPNTKLKSRTKSLAREIEGKRLQVKVYEKSIEMDFQSISQDLEDPAQAPEAIEERFRQLLILMNISIANPYEERMYYNQLFELETDLLESINHYNNTLETINSDILLIEGTIKELTSLNNGSATEELQNSTSKFITKLEKLLSMLAKSRQLVQSRFDELQILKEKLDNSLTKISNEMPELLISYMLHLRIPIFNYEIFKRAALAPSFWLLGQPAQSLAKMPDSSHEVFLAVLLPLITIFITYASTHRLREKIVESMETTSSTSKRVLMQIWFFTPLSLGLFLAALLIEFPSNIILFKAAQLIAYLVAMKMAWCFRVLKKMDMPSTPFYALYWIFAMGTIVQFLHIPLIMMAFVWPVVLLVASSIMWLMRQKPYPSLEKRLISVSLIVITALSILCIEGHVYLSILLSMWWFLLIISLQLAISITTLLKEQTNIYFTNEANLHKGALISLLTPLVWITLVFALLIWTVSQFGEIKLFFNFLDNSRIISTAVVLLITILSLRLLTSCELAHSAFAASGKRPLKGFIQVSKLLVFIFGMGTAACFALGHSPWALLGGLGAIAAALLLVFKDTILALVAGVRIVLDDLVRINDWIEINSLGVDGNVVDVSLHCVKIQNFDRTIVTIPTTTLTKNSFKNWRGMTESGGRRIKRSIPIDLSSVSFLDEQWTKRLKKVKLLKDWFNQHNDKTTESDQPAAINQTDIQHIDKTTNLSAFRGYIDALITANEHVHKGLLFLVRHLEPDAKSGLPIEIYCFAKETNFKEYETIQADIFDHLLAILPLFGLRIFQRGQQPDSREYEIQGNDTQPSKILK